MTVVAIMAMVGRSDQRIDGGWVCLLRRAQMAFSCFLLAHGAQGRYVDAHNDICLLYT